MKNALHCNPAQAEVLSSGESNSPQTSFNRYHRAPSFKELLANYFESFNGKLRF